MNARRLSLHALRAVCIASTLLILTPMGAGARDRAAAAHTEPLAVRPEQRLEYYGADLHSEQFNMCSAMCDHGEAPDRLVEWFNALYGPTSLSINEVCYSDAVYLANHTGKTVWRYIAKASEPGCGSGNTTFGNGMLATGSVIGTPLAMQYVHQTTSGCSIHTSECRGLICVNSSTYIGNLAMCSSHLATDQSTAEHQRDEYIWDVNGHYGSSSKWMAGDFNLEGVTYPTYTSMWAFDTYPADNPDEQIDYQFVETSSWAYISPPSYYCDPSYSDHCYAIAHFG